MSEQWKFYGGPMSYFSAKVRPALRYKQIPFTEIWPDTDVYRDVIIARTGVAFIPIIVTDTDEVMQDSPRMFERIEELYPDPPIFPQDPAVRLVAEVIQDFADDALILPAMHYRWNFPEQRQWIVDEWTHKMGPTAVEFAKRMAGILPMLGVTEKTKSAVGCWYETLLDLLDAHLAASRFLLGDVLTIADFAMVGPFYAHLGRDVVPARIMRERTPRVMAWLHEVNDAAPPAPAATAPEVRESLAPLLAEIGRVFVPMQLAVSAFADEVATALNPGDEVPRMFGMTGQPILDLREDRIVSAYSVWRHRRSAERYAALSDESRETVDDLLGRAGVLPYLERAPATPIVMKGFKLELGE